MPTKGSFRNWLRNFTLFLRRHSWSVSLLLGLVVAVGGAFLWHKDYIGVIRGSLLIGIGSSAIAAGIVAFLSPFYEAAYRKFVSLGIEKVWPSREAVKKTDWVDMVNAAKDTCTLLGIAHGGWLKDDRFLPALKDRLKRGVKVKILFLDPNCASAKLRKREEGDRRDTEAEIRKSIKTIWEFQRDLQPSVKERLRIYVYDATPSCGLTWIDDYMIITHYLAGLPDVTSPAIRVQPAQIGTGGLYDVYAENVENMEQRHTTELDDRNIKRFLPTNGEGATRVIETTSQQILETGDKK
jgi:hypothetical protein